MVGITSYGAYIPWYRINRKTIFSAMGWLDPATLMPGEKAVANYDEDALTMAVAADMDCLKGQNRQKIDGLYLATTSSPYRDRQAGIIIATALDIRPDIRIADFTDSNKAGTSALISACDAIKAGTAKNILLCASDCRLGKAGSSQEEIFGDGAASLVVGDSDVIATFEGHYSVSYDFLDHWRSETDRFDRAWEDRFSRDIGYANFISEAISGLLKKYKLNIKDFAKIVYPCLYTRDHAAIGKKVGAGPDQIQQEMLSTVGETGAASPLLMLVAALEEAKPGDRILVASYGSGSDALAFQVTDKIEQIRKDRRGFKKHLNSKKELTSYEKYLTFRNIMTVEKGMRGEEEPYVQMSMLWRERRTITGLCGTRCKKCGTPQYPSQRICVKPGCGALDQMEDYRFSDKTGKIFTYTADSLAFSISPPVIYGVVDFDGGGRYWFDITDCELNSLDIDMPVEMSFRKKFVDVGRGIHTYFWKATPIRA